MLSPLPRIRNFRVANYFDQAQHSNEGRTPSHSLNLYSSPGLVGFTSSNVHVSGHLLSIATVCEADISLKALFGVFIQCLNLTFTYPRKDKLLSQVTHMPRPRRLIIFRRSTYDADALIDHTQFSAEFFESSTSLEVTFIRIEPRDGPLKWRRWRWEGELPTYIDAKEVRDWEVGIPKRLAWLAFES